MNDDTKSKLLERARTIASSHLEAIRELFKDGVHITLLVRRPGAPTQDFILTDDADDVEVRAMVARHFTREAA